MAEKKKSTLSLVMLLILSKSAKLLKLTKLFKVAKPLVLVVSMSISAIAYTFMMGPWLAILFVVLILIHEMGHVVAMKMKGMDTPTPVFIPFLGAAIFAPKMKDRHTEAFVGYGGPFLGTIGSAIIFGIWFFIPKGTPLAHVLLVGSYLGMYINLFNLLPISPLDGGRITQAVGKWFKFIGLIGLAIFSVIFREPVILYVWIIVLFDLTIVPILLRAILVSGCWIAMATLMSLGYGDQPMWINVMDCIITLPFTIQLVASAIKRKDEIEEDDRIDLPQKQRVQWFVRYVMLTAILVMLVLMQLPLLPTRL